MVTECPHCGVSLIGDPIPDDVRPLYGNKTHFMRQVGIIDMAKDRIVEWQCPDCNLRWPVRRTLI